MVETRTESGRRTLVELINEHLTAQRAANSVVRERDARRLETDVAGVAYAEALLAAVATVMVIVPWNYPFLTACNSIVPALMGGNSAILEWGLSHDQEAVVTVTDTRFERILRRVGGPLERFSPPMQIDSTKALAGRLPISESSPLNVCEMGQLISPVLATCSRHVIAA
ncbi:MAG: aldehyde dehydrogenase family protein [Mesorhizobium sp.]|uniref:aldehyde dehydrogenase family protein n=1 Tax=Mesorhizobium sp. TaxID=1871066 RepID=UPI000FE6F4A6|nr:aldehyde dehydrogenase family protein [Mesorhizobium sp.]RWK65640.1 MAG: aldehyde dehydrogenase family protein [Mesorhizobium sp.]RWM53859.1 MAG: aldehyde dehydrogenase family protein [Mesorhizobium sp.]RWM60773.1 MAG: aldehyde dehydrogenase family protein [Mesorhizobium sp.]RWM62033.1 MAG: aldehyde dehydrogenase family protein [Mesorhizobium sp.]RWN03742.1 MAG: aldehyde dehydrogenase family protein [Mesorhizobium sp.]